MSNQPNSSCSAFDGRKDAYEAFVVFNSFRNIFFWLFLVIPMIFVQSGFWIVENGYVDPVICPETMQQQDGPEITDASNVEAPSESTLSDDEQAQVVDKAQQRNKLSRSFDFMLYVGMKSCNAILIFAAVNYCLALLIGIKLALTANIGGLACLTKAFFLSMIAMVFILPWQQIFSSELYGTLFSYQELKATYLSLQNEDSLGEYLLYYGRFCGLWLITAIVLIAAQWRSNRAITVITKRINAASKPQAVTTTSVATVSQPVQAAPPAPIPLENVSTGEPAEE